MAKRSNLRKQSLEIPTELQQALAGTRHYNKPSGLCLCRTNGEYADYIAEAKQTITRETPEKITGMILKRPDFTTTTGNEIFIYQNCSCHTYCFVLLQAVLLLGKWQLQFGPFDNPVWYFGSGMLAAVIFLQRAFIVVQPTIGERSENLLPGTCTGWSLLLGPSLWETCLVS